MTHMNDHINNTTTLNLEPIEVVANLDMVGQIFSQVTVAMEMAKSAAEAAEKGEDGDFGAIPIPPLAVISSAMILLRAVRDDIAAKHGLGREDAFKTPEYQACLAMREMYGDGTIDANRKGS